MNISPDSYLKAWNFASVAHQNQVMLASNVSYLNHVGSVGMEAFITISISEKTINDPELLMQCALLHDVLEDTSVTYDEIKKEFNLSVAEGVLALTKNKNFPTKKEQMQDSLNRIILQPVEIWMVKMCDRITITSQKAHWL